jgi:glycine cleavage system H protein
MFSKEMAGWVQFSGGMFMAEVAPKNGEFLDGKLWFHRKGSVLTVGLTSAAVEDIGSVQSIEFPDEGDDFQKGDTVVTLDGAIGKLEVITPATGVIQEVNEAAKEEPDMVSEDPLEEGWLFKMEMEDTSELQELKSG